MNWHLALFLLWQFVSLCRHELKTKNHRKFCPTAGLPKYEFYRVVVEWRFRHYIKHVYELGARAILRLVRIDAIFEIKQLTKRCSLPRFIETGEPHAWIQVFWLRLQFLLQTEFRFLDLSNKSLLFHSLTILKHQESEAPWQLLANLSLASVQTCRHILGC